MALKLKKEGESPFSRESEDLVFLVVHANKIELEDDFDDRILE
jgi:hypothetical protein